MFNLFNTGTSSFNIFGNISEPLSVKTTIRRRRKRKSSKNQENEDIENLDTSGLDELLAEDDHVDVEINDGTEAENVEVKINDGSNQESRQDSQDNERKFVTININIGDDEEKVKIEREFSYVEIEPSKLENLFSGFDTRFSLTVPNLKPTDGPEKRIIELERLYKRALEIVKE